MPIPPIAQLVEQVPFKDKVPGSIPGGRTSTKTSTRKRAVFVRPPTATVWGTVASGIENLLRYFGSEAEQNIQKVYCSVGEIPWWADVCQGSKGLPGIL